MKNEALDKFKELKGNSFPFDTFGSQYNDRINFVRKYAWAVPDQAALQAIADCGKIVEIGAGTGYWAHLLREMGVDVVAFDKAPYENGWCNNIWTEIERGGPEEAGKHPDRTLFLCWPPYAQPMAADTLRHYTNAGGKQVVYVGEGFGGCTGDDDFHEMLDRDYKFVCSVHIPRWFGMNDSLKVYRRRV